MAHDPVRYGEDAPEHGERQKHNERQATPGLFGLARKSWQTRLVERATEMELRALACQERVIAARRAVVEADLSAHAAVAEMARAEELRALEHRLRKSEMALQAEEAEAERALLRSVRQAPPEEARRILGTEAETERLLLERARLRGERLGRPLNPAAAFAPAPADPAPPALEALVTDRQVETLAVRALTRFAGLPPEEADRQWAAWRDELRARLPAYAAAEVERRADELRGLGA